MTGETAVWLDNISTYGFALRPSLECSGRYVLGANRSGEIPPLSSVDAPLTVDGAGLLPGHYETSVELRSNDPVHPVQTIPISVEVLADSDGDGVADPADNCPHIA